MATDISCVLPRPDIEELHEKFSTELSARMLGGAPVLPMSFEDIMSFVMAGATNLAWGYVNQALREADPATMCCDNLVAYASRHGFNLRGATRAKGYVIANGTAGATIPANIRFIGTNGIEYKLDPAITTNPATLDANGRAALRVVSSGAGTVYNIAAGAQLTVGSTVPGVAPTATVSDGGIGGGANAESCDELRTRIVAAEARGVISTNLDWYLSEGEKYPGVVKVCDDKCTSCCDATQVALYPFFGNVYPPYGVPPGSVIDAMNEWMFGKRAGMGEGLAPFGVRGAFHCALPTVVDVELQCYKGCSAAVAEAVTENLQAYISESFCVGEAICKSHLTAVVSATVGADGCFSDVVYHLDGTQWTEDAANIYLDCGHFLVLGEVTVQSVALLKRPVILSLDPASAVVGDDPVTVTIHGENFTPSTSVSFNGKDTPASYVSPTAMAITVHPADLNEAAQVPILMQNGTLLTSNTMNFALIQAPLALTKLTPDTANLPASTFTLALDGTGFSPTSIVVFDGAEVATTFVSSTHLTAKIANAASYTQPKQVPGVVRRGSLLSNTLVFDFAETPLQLVSMSPVTVAVGSGQTEIAIFGTGFADNSVVTFDGVPQTTTYVSSTTVKATVDAGDAARTIDVVVKVGSKQSNTLALSIIVPLPVVASLDPSTVYLGDPGQTITVNGQNFADDAVILVDGAEVDTTFVSATELSFDIETQDTVGQKAVSVKNGTTVSNTAMLNIWKRIVLSELTPESAALEDDPVKVTLTGEGFSDQSRVMIGANVVAHEFVSETELTIDIDPGAYDEPVTLQISVREGDSRSEALPFEIVEAAEE